MGEANPQAMALITTVIGHAPRYGETPDGEQCLLIGDTVLVATRVAFWSAPTAWQHGDGSLTVAWGGQRASFTREVDGTWTADIQRDPLAGKARFVS